MLIEKLAEKHNFLRLLLDILIAILVAFISFSFLLFYFILFSFSLLLFPFTFHFLLL